MGNKTIPTVILFVFMYVHMHVHTYYNYVHACVCIIYASVCECTFHWPLEVILAVWLLLWCPASVTKTTTKPSGAR